MIFNSSKTLVNHGRDRNITKYHKELKKPHMGAILQNNMMIWIF
jgi:hypothetical protein